MSTFLLMYPPSGQISLWYNTSWNGLLHQVRDACMVPPSSVPQISCILSLIHYWRPLIWWY